MINKDKLPKQVITALEDIWECSVDHDNFESKLAYLTVEEVMDLWLNWEGIINYTNLIFSTYEAMKQADDEI